MLLTYNVSQEDKRTLGQLNAWVAISQSDPRRYCLFCEMDMECLLSLSFFFNQFSN